VQPIKNDESHPTATMYMNNLVTHSITYLKSGHWTHSMA